MSQSSPDFKTEFKSKDTLTNIHPSKVNGGAPGENPKVQTKVYDYKPAEEEKKSKF